MVSLFLTFFLYVEAPVSVPEWTGNRELDRAFALNNEGRYHEAFVLFSTLHEEGVPLAGTMVGRYYESGRAVSRDWDRARKLFVEAKERGEAFGWYHYLRFTEGEAEFLRNPDAGAMVAALLQEAESGNNAPVQTVLAACYLGVDSIGYPRPAWADKDAFYEGVAWMRRAAYWGYAPARHNMVDHSFGPEKYEWWKLAKESGYPPAQYRPFKPW